MRDQMKLMCCFVSDVKVSAAARLLNMRRGTVAEYYDNLRGEWYDNLNALPIVFDDVGEYEVDECVIKHVMNTRGKGHHIQWIGGILERATGRVLLYQVKDRSQQSLIPPILQNIPIGSWIYSDDWSSYGAIDKQPYMHFSVNHSKKEYCREEEFCDRKIKVHINTLAEIMYRKCARDPFYPFKC